mgnify:CR=1 FL=1
MAPLLAIPFLCVGAFFGSSVPAAHAAETATEDVAAFDALTLTEGQIDVVADLLRENHGVDVGADELRDLLARTRTRKKYRGVETREWDERETEKVSKQAREHF